MLGEDRAGRGASPGPLVLVDRDGTLIEDRRYLSDPKEVALAPGVLEELLHLRSHSARVIVVTDQSGAARGYFSMAEVEAVHAEIEDRLARHRLRLDGWYVCPHGPDDARCCRKPPPALVLRAREERRLDPAGCFVIGDEVGDAKLGLACGGTGILVRPGAGPRARLSRSGRLALVPTFDAAAGIAVERHAGRIGSGGASPGRADSRTSPARPRVGG